MINQGREYNGKSAVTEVGGISIVKRRNARFVPGLNLSLLPKVT